MNINSYPSIYNLGHKAVAELLTVPVYVEEKVDGSQFSFMLQENGELVVRSKGASMYVDAPEKMFTKAVTTVKEIAGLLKPGWVYRGEFLAKPKHNTLVYNRTPEKFIIIFDINPGLESYLSYEEKRAEAARIGLETVPLVYEGIVSGLEQFREFLDRESILGGPKVEGVVVKPKEYALFGLDKKCLFGKFVSEAFKESHSKEWAKENPGGKDIMALLAAEFCTSARWAKSVQHLREAGQIEDSPRDIGKLIKEAGIDLHRECAEEIKDKLFKWAWPQIQRRALAGLPEWYKEELLKKQFETGVE